MPRRRVLLDYGLAIVTAVFAAMMRWALRGVAPSVLPDTPFLFFFFAIILSAWVGGFGPGAVATVLSILLARFLFIEPLHSLSIVGGQQLFRICYFLFQGLLTCMLFEGLKRAAARSQAAAVALRKTLAERDAVEQARRESEQRFGTLADTAPVLIWMSGVDKLCTYVNKVWLDFTGRPIGQELGNGWSEGVHAKDVAGCLSTYANAFEKRQPFVMDYRLRRRDGQYRWITANGVPRFTPDGQFLGYVGACVDIHDRREAEMRLEAVVKNAVDAIINIDEHGLIETFNPAAEKQFGYSKEEVIGKNVNLLMPAPYHDEHDKYVGNYLTSGVARIIGIGREVTGLRKDGSTFPMDLAVSEVELHGRKTFTGIVHDLTERKMAEDQLLRAKEAAEGANRDKDQFLAMISHELRTPLTAILGWAELLMLGASDPAELMQGVETIGRNARVQSRLIEDLLDISRIISGKLRLDIHQVRMETVVDAAIESMRHAADAKKISLRRRTDVQDLYVNADAARLQQVVWNLLSNAIKFTQAGGAVDVFVERSDGSALITVTDNGPGIDPAFLPQMFHRFHQADSSSTRKHGGLGLGLSIARHLVEMHGGTIGARNTSEGSGAVFTVRVPVAGQPTDGETLASISDATLGASRITGTDRTLDGLRVLVVDDESDTLELIARVLRRSGAMVTAVTTAAEALNCIRQSRPDVLLSDIAMPGEDGYALIRKVRQMAPPQQNIPAAALTAFARAEDRTRALLAGFQMHVAKPVEPAELTAVVADLAGRKMTR